MKTKNKPTPTPPRRGVLANSEAIGEKGLKYSIEKMTQTGVTGNLTPHNISYRTIKFDDSDINRIEFLEELFSHPDALHIALAEKAGVDYLITCDDQMV